MLVYTHEKLETEMVFLTSDFLGDGTSVKLHFLNYRIANYLHFYSKHLLFYKKIKILKLLILGNENNKT